MNTVRDGKALGKSLRKIAKLTGDDFALILQGLGIRAFRNLVMLSARKTGFLRSRWDYVVDTTAPTEKLKGSPGASYGTAQMDQGGLSRVKTGSRITIYNNTEYAGYLENGTAKMRAQPMVEPTYQAIESTARALADKLSKKDYKE